MESSLEQFILKSTGANSISQIEPIQELWSGFGQINRVFLNGVNHASIIVKDIDLSSESNHPRGWDTETSHLRKVRSYEVEQSWYESFAEKCSAGCRTASFFGAKFDGDRRILLLEDLNEAGYSLRKDQLKREEVKVCLSWLAHFHATFMGSSSESLWGIGSYWHLLTRQDEFIAMEASKLKESAAEIDRILNSCQYKTIVHGDAKVANFCFSEDSKEVAAVDFQYAGGGCGMKDVAYLFSSCLDEMQCAEWEVELLNYYFEMLLPLLSEKYSDKERKGIELEWRKMYSFAWADFYRFLQGWSPGHYKLNVYGQNLTKEALLRI